MEARKLYFLGGRPWRCRPCSELTYASRQAIRRRRLLIKAKKIRESLGGSPSMLGNFGEAERDATHGLDPGQGAARVCYAITALAWAMFSMKSDQAR